MLAHLTGTTYPRATPDHPPSLRYATTPTPFRCEGGAILALGHRKPRLRRPKLKVCPVTRTAGQTAAVSLHTQQGGTVARRPTSEGARAIKPARAHRTGALQADERSPRMSNPKP